MDVYEKSLEVLKEIIKNQEKLSFRIALVGGWAVYAFNPYMKSKDIDLLIEKRNFWKLRDFLESLGFRQTVSKPLDKKGFAMLFEDDKIEVDVYDEKIAKFEVEEVFENKRFETGRINGEKVLVLEKNLLLTLKIFSAIERLGTAKGIKDHSDILALFDRFYPKFDFEFLKSQVNKEQLEKVFRLVFTDYKKIKSIYPIEFLKYQRIKNGVLKQIKI